MDLGAWHCRQVVLAIFLALMSCFLYKNRTHVLTLMAVGIQPKREDCGYVWPLVTFQSEPFEVIEINWLLPKRNPPPRKPHVVQKQYAISGKSFTVQ